MTELKNNSLDLKSTNRDQLISKLKENKKYILILLGAFTLVLIFVFSNFKKNDIVEVPVRSEEHTS